MLKMSVMTFTHWLLAHVFSTRPGMLSGAAALLVFTLSRIFLTDRGRSSAGGVDFTLHRLFVVEIKASIKYV